ncbi:MAG TPA: hypothetical protein VK025_14355 [Steroidobacter sp.]|nr:hypothetical protein [Steroidobacter sp.]
MSAETAAQRNRRHKKLLADMIRKAWGEVFNEWFELVARENPRGSTTAAIRWFTKAWHRAEPPA